MKRVLLSTVAVVALLVIPGFRPGAAASSPPPCRPGPNGECILVHNGSYTDPSGINVSATWDVDINSGNIVAVYPSTSMTELGHCGPQYYPSDPNKGPYYGPVTVYYQEVNAPNDVELTMTTSGSYSGRDGDPPVPCI